MTEPDDALRGALRDLIPDYTGPQDPVPRVVARVRRRRVRQRALLAAGAVGVASVVAVTVPALLVTGDGGSGIGAAAGPSPSAAEVGPPPPPPTVHPVAAGRIGGTAWAIGSTSLEAGSRRCLYSDDAIFHRQTVCFERWKAGRPVAWAAQSQPGPGADVTWLAGIAPAGTDHVRVRLTGGPAETVAAVRTPTDPAGRFFGLVVAGDRTVVDITLLDAAGTPIGRPATDPGDVSCVPSPVVGCAGK